MSWSTLSTSDAGALTVLLLSFGLLVSPVPLWLPIPVLQQALVQSIVKWQAVFAVGWLANSFATRWAENRWLLSRDLVAWDWANEVAVITGGSNGLGAKLVERLVAHGLKVAVLDVEPLSTPTQSEGTVAFYQCDITSPTAIHRAAEAIRAKLGSPSILINNAGIGNAGTILEATPESLRTIFNVNLISHWYTVQEFLPDMISRKKGHIMGTASMAAFLGMAGMVDYSCTKVGLQAFYEGLAQELKHRYNCPYIKTTVVYPNWFRTRLTSPLERSLKKTRQQVGNAEDVADVMVRQILARRSGQLILGPSSASIIRASPIWLQEAVRDWMAHVVEIRATTAVA